jgi:hypothetical protein
MQQEAAEATAAQEAVLETAKKAADGQKGKRGKGVWVSMLDYVSVYVQSVVCVYVYVCVYVCVCLHALLQLLPTQTTCHTTRQVRVYVCVCVCMYFSFCLMRQTNP